jgi:hypothetical protein
LSAVQVEAFIIAKAGKPLVKVTALEVPLGGQVRRLGFMSAKGSVSKDLTRWAKQRLKNCLAEMNEVSA